MLELHTSCPLAAQLEGPVYGISETGLSLQFVIFRHARSRVWNGNFDPKPEPFPKMTKVCFSTHI